MVSGRLSQTAGHPYMLDKFINYLTQYPQSLAVQILRHHDFNEKENVF